LDFEDLLASDDPPIRCHLVEQAVHEGCLAGPGCTGDKNRLVGSNGGCEQLGGGLGERPQINKRLESLRREYELADLDVEAVGVGDRGACDMYSASV